MGRKRKAAVADEVKTSKSYLETTSPDKRSRPNAENSSDVELNSNGSPEEKKTPTILTTNSVLRRSGRLRSPVYPSRRQQEETVVEHVILDENEKEVPDSEKRIDTLAAVDEKNSDVEMQVGQVSSPPEDNDEGSLLEKVNYLVRAGDEFKPKVMGRRNEASPSDSRYKSLYLKLQKKNEALMEENYELVRNLEFVRGQLAAYEKMMETMGALKEVRYVSGLGKFTDANTSLPPETVKNCVPSPSAAAAGAVPDTAGDDDDDNNPKQTRKSSKKKKARI
ncbi:hypothetical protein OROHE_024021 [Orobanche hederae]